MDTKISFIKQLYQPEFSLIESIYFHNKFRNLDLHLDRLENPARRLFFDIDIQSIATKLCEYSKKLTINKIYKIRLEHTYNQNIFIEHTEIESLNTQPILLQICLERVDSNNQLFNYKTTHKSTRGFYTNMHDKYIGDKITQSRFF